MPSTTTSTLKQTATLSAGPTVEANEATALSVSDDEEEVQDCRAQSDGESSMEVTLTHTPAVASSASHTISNGSTSISVPEVPEELSECDVADLHTISQIQAGAGHLIFVDYPSGRVIAHDERLFDLELIGPSSPAKKRRLGEATKTTCSGATTTMAASDRATREHQTSPKTLVNQIVWSWIPSDLAKEIQETIETAKASHSLRTFCFYSHHDHHGDANEKAYGISLSSTKDDYSIIGIEIEEVDANEETAQLSTTLSSLGQVVESFNTSYNMAETACNTVFHILGKFDRAMVYKFHDDSSGEVIHEVKKDSVTSSYKGMRFPKGDIPLNARKLFVQNRLRYISNVDSTDIPVISSTSTKPKNPMMQPSEQQNQQSESILLDLTQIRMRAVHKSHILYLKTMGVVSTISIAIVVEGKLWGLLVFHSYTKPFKPSLQQRIALETVGQMVSVRIEAHSKKLESLRIVKLTDALMKLKAERSVIHNMHDWGNELLDLCDSDIVICHVQDARDGEGDQVKYGNEDLVPSRAVWTRLMQQPDRELLVVSKRDEISALGLTEEECPASGFVFFRQGRTAIMLGRGTRSQDVSWGGNPDEPKTRIGGILGPRQSFDLFIEKARKESRAWSGQDINVISVLRDRLCNHSYAYTLGQLQNDVEVTNKKYIDAVDRARDNYEFFAHMSHELRTPFHGVMGCLNILHDSIQDIGAQEAKDVVKTAISSGEHMINLLNDILEIAKKKHMSHVCANNKLIYQSFAFETIDCMRSLASSRNTRLDYEIGPKTLKKTEIITDKTKVMQIVTNVVNNAIKFTGDGGIKVRFQLVDTATEACSAWMIDAEEHTGAVLTVEEGKMMSSVEEVKLKLCSLPQEKKKKWLCVSVEDTGCGIKPVELADMFAPYTQSSSGSNRHFQGTGLGLYICISLCRQLQGFMGCASTPKRGTTFHIGIPVDAQVATALKMPNSTSVPALLKEVPSIVADIPIHGPILIVDDNKINVKILLRTLQLEMGKWNMNIKIASAFGGKEAVTMYKELHPSLCIIDYHMPEVDGVAATKQIRDYEKSVGMRPCHIMSYTADGTDKANELILSSGANEIMSKPPPKGFVATLVKRFGLQVSKATDDDSASTATTRTSTTSTSTA